MQKNYKNGAYSDEIKEAIDEITTELTFRRGQTITAIANMRNNLYYLISGAARVFYLHGGKEHTYSFAFNNEFISLSHPLLNDSNLTVTIEFLENTTLMSIPLDGVERLLKDMNRDSAGKIMYNILSNVQSHMIHLEERILMLQTYSAPERYQWIINRYPLILERANISQIASYLGITKETLYRIRSGKYKNDKNSSGKP